MSKAEELLNTLDSNGSVAVLSADASTEPHIVIGRDRFITVPDELKRIAVQYDHNIETVTFDCPRYWDEHDMSELEVYINYRRSDNKAGTYKTTAVTVDSSDDSIIHFDWTISKNVTWASGQITFNVCIKQMDESGTTELRHWNSELCKDCHISEGFEIGVVDDADNTISQKTQVYIGPNEVTAVPTVWFDTSEST